MLASAVSPAAPRGFDLECAVPVDRAGVDEGLRRLGHRKDLPGNWGLIDRADTTPDDPIEGETLARLHEKHRSDRDCLCGYLAGTVVFNQPDRVWCNGKQRLDGAPGAADAP